VPAIRSVENGVTRETLFPHFVEYRQQIDGKYWFPTVDFSDDTLQFAFGPVHVQVLVKYSNYRSFGAESRVMSSESDLELPVISHQDDAKNSASRVLGRRHRAGRTK